MQSKTGAVLFNNDESECLKHVCVVYACVLKQKNTVVRWRKGDLLQLRGLTSVTCSSDRESIRLSVPGGQRDKVIVQV